MSRLIRLLCTFGILGLTRTTCVFSLSLVLCSYMSKEEKKIVKAAAKDLAKMSVRSAGQPSAKKVMRKHQKSAVKAQLKHESRLALPYQRALRGKLEALQYLACVMNPVAENAIRLPDVSTSIQTGLLCPRQSGTLGTQAGQTMCSMKIVPGWETCVTNPDGQMVWGVTSTFPGSQGRQFTAYSQLGQSLILGYRWIGMAFELRVLETPFDASGVLCCAVEPGLIGGLGTTTGYSTLSQYPGAVTATMSEVMANGGVFRGFLTFSPQQIVMASTFTAVDQLYDPRLFRQRAAQATETMPRLAFVCEGLKSFAGVNTNRFALTIFGVLEFESLNSILMATGTGSDHRPEQGAFALQEDAAGPIGNTYRGVVPAAVSGNIGPAEVYKTLATAEPAGVDSGILSDYASNLRQSLAIPMAASKHIWDAAKWAGSEALKNLPLGDMADAALGAGADYLGTLLA